LPVRAFFIGAIAPGFEAYERQLRQLISEHGLSERVTFVGFREDAPALLAGFDIATLPLRREAFGRVVVESMNAGLPIVGYDEGAFPELVREGEEGYLVANGDLDAFAERVARLVRDPALRERLGEQARHRARLFSHERFVAEMSAVYRELLAVPARRG
jgi:glycosyltransferase involved in cell wall biosynthesis